VVVLGLTGSIGMGKSTAASMLRRLGVPVHDADAAVHRLLGKDGDAVAAVADAFPGVERAGAIDRAALGKIVFADPAALKKLEAILHPMVRGTTGRFLAAAARARRRVVVLDIPLLFEGGNERRCDGVIVVSAPQFLQAQRVLRRPGMTPARLAAILAAQMPDREKRRRADVVVNSGLGKCRTGRQLARVVRNARCRRGQVWRPGYLSTKSVT
jgi:dephospho-CoA kinase